jgi:hypothetical protein
VRNSGGIALLVFSPWLPQRSDGAAVRAARWRGILCTATLHLSIGPASCLRPSVAYATPRFMTESHGMPAFLELLSCCNHRWFSRVGERGVTVEGLVGKPWVDVVQTLQEQHFRMPLPSKTNNLRTIVRFRFDSPPPRTQLQAFGLPPMIHPSSPSPDALSEVLGCERSTCPYFLLQGGVNHGQDARLERRRQRRPGVEDALHVGVEVVSAVRSTGGG